MIGTTRKVLCMVINFIYVIKMNWNLGWLIVAWVSYALTSKFVFKAGDSFLSSFWLEWTLLKKANILSRGSSSFLMADMFKVWRILENTKAFVSLVFSFDFKNAFGYVDWIIIQLISAGMSPCCAYGCKL